MSELTNQTETFPEGTIAFSNSSLLLFNEQYYEIEQLVQSQSFTINEVDDTSNVHHIQQALFMMKNDLINDDATQAPIQRLELAGTGVDESKAYICGPCFFVYQSRGTITDPNKLEPGLYFDEETDGYFVEFPSTLDEFAKYNPDGKITRTDIEEIRDAINNHSVTILVTPDVAQYSVLEESVDDDLLKRGIKRALKQKGVDLDECRTRFISKNTLFNTKQVLRGPNRLSVLVFDRCIEGLGLNYTVTITEAGGECVGLPLSGPIVLSANDTYSADLKTVDSEDYTPPAQDLEFEEQDDDDI